MGDLFRPTNTSDSGIASVKSFSKWIIVGDLFRPTLLRLHIRALGAIDDGKDVQYPIPVTRNGFFCLRQTRWVGLWLPMPELRRFDCWAMDNRGRLVPAYGYYGSNRKVDMSDYRRWYVQGGMYFFTVVTYGRRPILTTDEGRSLLHQAIWDVNQTYPFTVFATILLPDHWHLIMQLPTDDSRYSIPMKRIKEIFTSGWLARGLPEADVTPAQREKGERGIWQPRFWEHTIKDEEDLEIRTDYIHWNPRKHKVAPRVRDWQWSSFHRFVKLGHYDIDWGGTEPESLNRHQDWGE